MVPALLSCALILRSLRARFLSGLRLSSHTFGHTSHKSRVIVTEYSYSHNPETRYSHRVKCAEPLFRAPTVGHSALVPHILLVTGVYRLFALTPHRHIEDPPVLNRFRESAETRNRTLQAAFLLLNGCGSSFQFTVKGSHAWIISGGLNSRATEPDFRLTTCRCSDGLNINCNTSHLAYPWNLPTIVQAADLTGLRIDADSYRPDTESTTINTAYCSRLTTCQERGFLGSPILISI